MDIIKLSEDQKVKLLEMANSLFINEDWRFSLDSPPQRSRDHVFVMGFIGDNDYIPNCDCYMHWFEFCMTKLVDKIYYPDKRGGRATKDYVKKFMFDTFLFADNSGIVTYHPIDYLYKEFKKLKKDIILSLSPKSNPTIWNKLVNIIVSDFGVSKEEIKDNITFHELSFDMLDLVELAMKLEKEFNISIPDELLNNLTTPLKLYNWLSVYTKQ